MHPGPEAWHEAGHALIAHLLGGEVRLVTLESELDDHEGHTEVLWVGLDALELARVSAWTALAGPVAETLFRGEEIDDPEVLASWRRDWDESELRLREVVDDAAEREALRRRWVADLVVCLEEPTAWEALARLADALDAHRTLDATLVLDALD